jgi:hypothetical protein
VVCGLRPRVFLYDTRPPAREHGEGSAQTAPVLAVIGERTAGSVLRLSILLLGAGTVMLARERAQTVPPRNRPAEEKA